MADMKMRKATAAGCLIGTAWLMAAAGELVVGTGETHVFTNAAAVTQTDAVRVSDRAVLVQRGAGTTTLKGGAFTENKTVAINV